MSFVVVYNYWTKAASILVFVLITKMFYALLRRILCIQFWFQLTKITLPSKVSDHMSVKVTTQKKVSEDSLQWSNLSYLSSCLANQVQAKSELTMHSPYNYAFIRISHEAEFLLFSAFSLSTQLSVLAWYTYSCHCQHNCYAPCTTVLSSQFTLHYFDPAGCPGRASDNRTAGTAMAVPFYEGQTLIPGRLLFTMHVVGN